MEQSQRDRLNTTTIHKKLKSSAGFTLLEVMVAICIFSIGLLAVGSMQVSGTQGTASARRHTAAVVWASDQIEKIISLPYDHADLADGSHAGVTKDLYNISWDVSEDELIDNTKAIVVTVSWNDFGISKNFSFTYYKANI